MDLFHSITIDYFLYWCLSLHKSQSWLTACKCFFLRRTVLPVSWRRSVMQPLSRYTCARHFTIHNFHFHLTVNSILTLRPLVFQFMYARDSFQNERRCSRSFIVWRGQVAMFLTICRLTEEEVPGGARDILTSLWGIMRFQFVSPWQYCWGKFGYVIYVLFSRIAHFLFQQWKFSQGW
jgi:hypothetical protein